MVKSISAVALTDALLPNRHLQALEDYFNLMDIISMLHLPSGRGNPPQDDPQIFLGAMSYDPCIHMYQKPVVSTDNLKTDSNFISFVTFSPLFIFLCFTYNNPALCHQSTLISCYPPIMGHLCSVHHPGFTHISTTQYAIHNPHRGYHWNVDVGQIMNYLAFDSHLCEHGNCKGTPPVRGQVLHPCPTLEHGLVSDGCTLST